MYMIPIFVLCTITLKKTRTVLKPIELETQMLKIKGI